PATIVAHDLRPGLVPGLSRLGERCPPACPADPGFYEIRGIIHCSAGAAHAYLAGSNNSMGLPSGSSSKICLPAGPVSILLRKWRPAFLSFSIREGRSETCRTIRFHPPGSWRRPSGIGREPDAPGPLRKSLTFPLE